MGRKVVRGHFGHYSLQPHAILLIAAFQDTFASQTCKWNRLSSSNVALSEVSRFWFFCVCFVTLFFFFFFFFLKKSLTLPFQTFGLITKEERVLLNEIYEYSPVLYDFCLKRTMKGQKGERLPASLFMRNTNLF